GRTLVRPLATRSRSAFFPYTTLFRSQQAVEEVAPAEFRLVELGREVVVIEEEFLAQQLEESPDQHEQVRRVAGVHDVEAAREERSEEHTSELQSPYDLVCRLLLEKKK